MTHFKPNISRSDSEKYYLDPCKAQLKKPFPSLNDAATIVLTIVVPAYNEENRCKMFVYKVEY